MGNTAGRASGRGHDGGETSGVPTPGQSPLAGSPMVRGLGLRSRRSPSIARDAAHEPD